MLWKVSWRKYFARVSGSPPVFTASRLLFDNHDEVTVLHAAGADDSEYGRVTLLHIPLLLLKFFSSNSHGIHDPLLPAPLPPRSCCESQPNFISHSHERSARRGLGWRASLVADSRGHLTYLQQTQTCHTKQKFFGPTLFCLMFHLMSEEFKGRIRTRWSETFCI